MSEVLLDTAAYVDLQRARKHHREPWAANTLRHAAAFRLNGRFGLSTLTAFEITRGFEQESMHVKLLAFRAEIAEKFQIVEFDFEAACLTGEIYTKLELKGQRIGIPDTGLAAMAILKGYSLVTSNTSHFQRIVDLGYDLKQEDWRLR